MYINLSFVATSTLTMAEDREGRDRGRWDGRDRNRWDGRDRSRWEERDRSRWQENYEGIIGITMIISDFHGLGKSIIKAINCYPV